MSDTSQGPGWWQASDGKWYPPEQAPAAAPGAPAPGYGAPPAYGAPAYGAAVGSDGAPGPRASWGERVVAWLIDYGILIALYIVVFIVAAIFGAISDALGAIVFLVGYLAIIGYWFYVGYMNGLGGSVGKRLTGLKVVSIETGQTIGGGMGIVRMFAQIVNSIICYIGWFFPIWDAHQQTVGDKIMKTVVLKDQPKMAFGPDIFKPEP
ncbi:MAG: RDD family protein [Arthrobacter sp.]|nr:RDD family protein [Arthrobacter sp.]